MKIVRVVVVVVALLSAALSEASVHCSIHGDTHVLMSDGATRYQHHSAGLFRAFATSYGTKRLEVQCEFSDRATAQSQVVDPQMASCRVRIVDATLGCGLDLRHGGIMQPGVGSIGGRDMPLAALAQIPLNPALGVQIVPLTNNALSVEVNWNGTMAQIILGERLLQVHSTMVTQCVGLCGTCAGQQTAPTEPNSLNNFIAQYVVPANAAIQPDANCMAPLAAPRLGTSPQLFAQSTTTASQYPVPAYRPGSLDSAMYQAQFESSAVLMQSFQQCSDGDQARLSVDPWFNSFVEDCMYDKSLGPGFEPSAKASMDAYVTWTESLLRWARIDAALRQAPTMPLCAACIPVQWSDAVNTAAVLTPTVTVRKGALRFPLRYSAAASQYLVPGRFVRAYAGADFLSQSWNAPITLSPLSSLNLAPLPQQLVSTPIIVGSNSKDIASPSAGLSWNPMPTNQGGVCGVIDAPTMATYEQIAAQFVSGAQASQLVQLIRQGRYPFLACALTCQSTSASSLLTALATSIPPMEAALLCPAQQFTGNMFGNFNALQGGANNMWNSANNMWNGFPVNGFNGAANNLAMNGLGSFNGAPNSVVNGFAANTVNSAPNNVLNGFAMNGAPSNVFNGFPANGANSFNAPNGIFPINGNAPNGALGTFPVGGINSFGHVHLSGLGNFPIDNSFGNALPGNAINGWNGVNMNGNGATNGFGGVNGIAAGAQPPNQVLEQNGAAAQLSAFMF